jgi:uncharacterized protein (TIGR00299 family) protein
MAATKVHVKVRGKGSRRWKDVREIIEGSALSHEVKRRGLSVFKSLFQAEARVHGKRYDRVHLHELGALDAMVDIMGTLILVERLGIGEVCASAVNMGGGSTRTSHGTIPVPSPAAAELLKDVPVYSSRDDFELTTPTGAALIRALATDFGPLPAMRIEEVGVGAGNKDFPDMPNILRVFVGTGGPGGGEEVMVMETNLDDMDPRVVGYVAERLLEAGALDVWLTQVVMKKGRPGVKLSVLARREHRPGLQDIIFRETTTLGVRMWSDPAEGGGSRRCGPPLGSRVRGLRAGRTEARGAPPRGHGGGEGGGVGSAKGYGMIASLPSGRRNVITHRFQAHANESISHFWQD